MKTIWIGIIPDIFGYGMSVVAESESDCLKALKKDYEKNSEGKYDDYGDVLDDDGRKLTRFEKAMEHWGGRIEEVQLGKVYWDNFS